MLKTGIYYLLTELYEIETMLNQQTEQFKETKVYQTYNSAC